jgi:hypothetical protein
MVIARNLGGGGHVYACLWKERHRRTSYFCLHLLNHTTAILLIDFNTYLSNVFNELSLPNPKFLLRPFTRWYWFQFLDSLHNFFHGLKKSLVFHYLDCEVYIMIYYSLILFCKLLIPCSYPFFYKFFFLPQRRKK